MKTRRVERRQQGTGRGMLSGGLSNCLWMLGTGCRAPSVETSDLSPMLAAALQGVPDRKSLGRTHANPDHSSQLMANEEGPSLGAVANGHACLVCNKFLIC